MGWGMGWFFRFLLVLAIFGGAAFYLLAGRNPLEEAHQLYVRYLGEDRQQKLARLKEQEWASRWQPGPDCRQPGTSLKVLECKNREENARLNFEKYWAMKTFR